MGPNIKKLIARKMVTDAIPANGGLAPDNPYGDDDEAIAAEILRQIQARALAGRENAR